MDGWTESEVNVEPWVRRRLREVLDNSRLYCPPPVIENLLADINPNKDLYDNPVCVKSAISLYRGAVTIKWYIYICLFYN